MVDRSLFVILRRLEWDLFHFYQFCKMFLGPPKGNIVRTLDKAELSGRHVIKYLARAQNRYCYNRIGRLNERAINYLETIISTKDRPRQFKKICASYGFMKYTLQVLGIQKEALTDPCVKVEAQEYRGF